MEHEAAEMVRERTLDLVAERLGVSRLDLEAKLASGGDIGMDSLDLVEFVMELEEELDGER
jgi:acyl carrier protein